MPSNPSREHLAQAKPVARDKLLISIPQLNGVARAACQIAYKLTPGGTGTIAKVEKLSPVGSRKLILARRQLLQIYVTRQWTPCLLGSGCSCFKHSFDCLKQCTLLRCIGAPAKQRNHHTLGGFTGMSQTQAVSSQGKCAAFRFSSAAIPWYQRPPPSSKAHPSCITESCENTAWLLDAASLPSVFLFCSSSHASSQKTTTST